MTTRSMEPGELEEVAALLEQTRRALTGDSATYPRDFDFHLCLARLSKNLRLAKYTSEINVQLQLARTRSASSPERSRRAYEEHLAVFEGISEGDVEGAERAMRHHLRGRLESRRKIVYGGGVMSEVRSAGGRFRTAIREERPLQVVGAVNAYSAVLAETAGFRALYLSGAGVANSSFGLPDLGLTRLNDVLEETRRITAATELPLLVDGDTGWGDAFMIGWAIAELTRSGAVGLHIEDQVQSKRCGHRPGKQLVEPGEMADRIKAAVDARTDPEFVVMARTDAVAVEGIEPALKRARRYVEAGADMIFAEALTSLEEYGKFSEVAEVPVLANITEFGATPLFTVEELGTAGVSLVLYPLSAFRAMSAAALDVYETIRGKGTQKDVVEKMQTRNELYEALGYYEYEKRLDRLFAHRGV